MTENNSANFGKSSKPRPKTFRQLTEQLRLEREPREKAIAPKSDSLSQRSETADKSLSERYDALNQQFSEAELHLRLLKPSRPVWVYYSHTLLDAEMQITGCQALGLFKIYDKWRLCHAYGEDGGGRLDDIQPIIECPIEVRVRAAKEVRNLHVAIIQAKEQFIPEVEAAIKELTEFCIEA